MNSNEELYVLALVYTSNYDELSVFLNEISIDLNKIYQIPLNKSLDLREQLNSLILTDACYADLDELFEKSEFFIKLRDTCSTQEDCVNFKLNLLTIAVLFEKIPIIRLLIEFGADILPDEPLQIHPIHIALYKQNNDILRLLLDQVPNDFECKRWLNSLQDDQGFSSVEIAINYFEFNKSTLSLLYQHGIDLNAGHTPALMYALEFSDVSYELIKLLLSFGANPNSLKKRVNFQHSALIQAITLSRVDLVKLLLDYGADVNMIVDDVLNCCALQFIIEQANYINHSCEIARVLLEHGANPSFYGLSFCMKNGFTLDSIHSSMPVLDAIRSENIDLLKLLIEFGANIQTVTHGTYSPMCTACYQGHEKIVRLLLDNNVDPTASCRQSNTPLTIAVSMNFAHLVDILLPFYKNSQLINKQDGNGDFALLYACYNKNSYLAKKLIQAGASVELTNYFDCSPIWFSAYFNDKATFFELLPHVKDFTRKSVGVDYYNFQYPPETIYSVALSPLEVAFKRKYFNIVRDLRQIGVSMEPILYENNVHDDHTRSLFEYLMIPLSLERLCINKIHNFDMINERLINELPKNLHDLVLFKQI